MNEMSYNDCKNDTHMLFADVEKLGPRLIFHPTIAIGIALINKDKVTIAKDDNGKVCKEMFFLPMLPWQFHDPETMNKFYATRPTAYGMFCDWQQFCVENGINLQTYLPIYHEQVLRLIETIHYWFSLFPNVEIKLDTSLFDVSSLNYILENCASSQNLIPPSWNHLKRKPNSNEFVYSPIENVDSFYQGILHMFPDIEVRQHGSAFRAICVYFQIEEPSFPCIHDHYPHNDAARTGLEYAFIKKQIDHFQFKKKYGYN